MAPIIQGVIVRYFVRGFHHPELRFEAASIVYVAHVTERVKLEVPARANFIGCRSFLYTTRYIVVGKHL